MHSKLLVVLAALVFSAPSFAQVQPAATGRQTDLGIGGGMDYWRGDWGKIVRLGPSAWVTADLWHGLGINAEAHTLIAGGDNTAQRYKYIVGEGGAIYTYHHWRRFAPYAKYELGFASLNWPHKPTATYVHDTRNIWAMGGGFEYKLWRYVWVRGDYTYDGFPKLLQPRNQAAPYTGSRRLRPWGYLSLQIAPLRHVVVTNWGTKTQTEEIRTWLAILTWVGVDFLAPGRRTCSRGSSR